jgi:hypothetical protein
MREAEREPRGIGIRLLVANRTVTALNTPRPASPTWPALSLSDLQ